MLDLSGAFATFPVLTTARLVLRQPVAEDAPAMFTTMAHPVVMRYFGSPPLSQLEQAHERIDQQRRAFAEQEGVRWAITWREDGTYFGSCGFWQLIKPHFWAEVGYELGQAWWGQGVMPETVGAALAFGFDPMGLHSVEATIEPAKSGSRRVLEKLGFVQEGYFRESFYEAHLGHFSDSAVFSLLRTTWRERQDGALRGTSVAGL